MIQQIATAFTMLLLAVTIAQANPGVGRTTLSQIEDSYFRVERKAEDLSYLMSEANLGNLHATFYLGVANELGYGVAQRNNEAALEYYSTAADKLLEAAFNAARLHYMAGRIDSAVKFFVVAAGGDKANGVPRAMVMLGRIYEYGESSTGKNLAASARWYEAAALRKDPLAIGKIGEFLLHGKGRRANVRDAKIHLTRAAGMWNPEAQYMLGDFFSSGVFTPSNRTEAGKWYIIAATHSDNLKRRSFSYLAKLSPQEHLSAQKMAELWMAAHPRPDPSDPLDIISQINRY